METIGAIILFAVVFYFAGDLRGRAYRGKYK